MKHYKKVLSFLVLLLAICFIVTGCSFFGSNDDTELLSNNEEYLEEDEYDDEEEDDNEEEIESYEELNKNFCEPVSMDNEENINVEYKGIIKKTIAGEEYDVCHKIVKDENQESSGYSESYYTKVESDGSYVNYSVSDFNGNIISSLAIVSGNENCFATQIDDVATISKSTMTCQ